MMKETITQKLKNKLQEIHLDELRAGHKAHPEPTIASPTEKDGQGAGSNYDKIAAILNNPIVNTAAICELVLGDKEATNRSLFRKKLNREPNDSGSVYEFDENELLKIQTALMSFSTQIRKSIGRQGKG